MTAGPRLVVHDPLGRRVVAVDAPLFTIGRRAGNSLQLAGIEVSRDHAEIATVADGFVLRDRGSRYGTFVNGVRVAEQRLTHGDRIECGRSGGTLMFLTDAAAPSEETGSTPAAAEFRQVATLLDALRGMGENRVLDEVLALVLDAAIEATGAERGFIMLADEAGGLEMKLARQVGHITMPATGFKTSRKLPEEAFATGRTTVVADLLEGDMAAVHTGTVALGIRHVLCAPLRVVRYVARRDQGDARRNIGVLYLDSRERGRLLTAAARTALEDLASEAAVAIESARLYQETLEKARLDQELLTASRIQQALLPEARRSGAYFDAVGASVPSRAIGGDFFDYQSMSGDRFGVGLGDITGKGPPAALLTALVQGILAARAFTDGSPDEVIGLINRVLLARQIESRFLTLFLGVLAPDGTFTYCNAAQNPPLLFSQGSVRRLETGGTLVGAFSWSRYARETLALVPGDTLVLFSDGLTEATSATGEEFGEARIRAVAAGAIGGSPQEVLRALFDSVAAFTRGAPQHDDLTAVVVRYRGPDRTEAPDV